MSMSLASAVSGQSEMYMKLLMAQLRNQDPMEPMSNSEMVSQMAQLATLDSMNKLNAGFSDVLSLYRLASGTGMIGRDVSYLADDGTLSRDTVASALVSNGTPKLHLAGGDEISLADVREVFQQ